MLDEADEMLRMGFADDVDWVLTRSGRQQVLCWLIVAPVMAVLMAMLPGAIGLYVLVSLVLIFAQRWVVVQVVGAKRKRRRRPGARCAGCRRLPMAALS